MSLEEHSTKKKEKKEMNAEKKKKGIQRLFSAVFCSPSASLETQST